MSLGQNIHRLRGKKNMSQGDLADALGVSRQSISKWETDSAVPELEKLVKLSAIFSVTLDELVHGEASAPQPEPQYAPQPAAPPPPTIHHLITGGVLCAVSLLIFVVCTLLGGPIVGLILAIPFLLMGFLCLVSKNHPFLWMSWALLVIVDMYLRFATGLSWSTIRLTTYWTPELNYFRLFIAWMQFGCILLMMLCTVLILRKKPLELTGANRTRYILGWVGVVVLSLLMRLIAYTAAFSFQPLRMLYHLLDWCRIGLFTAQLCATARWSRTRRKEY